MQNPYEGPEPDGLSWRDEAGEGPPPRWSRGQDERSTTQAFDPRTPRPPDYGAPSPNGRTSDGAAPAAATPPPPPARPPAFDQGGPPRGFDQGGPPRGFDQAGRPPMRERGDVRRSNGLTGEGTGEHTGHAPPPPAPTAFDPHGAERRRYAQGPPGAAGGADARGGMGPGSAPREADPAATLRDGAGVGLGAAVAPDVAAGRGRLGPHGGGAPGGPAGPGAAPHDDERGRGVRGRGGSRRAERGGDGGRRLRSAARDSDSGSQPDSVGGERMALGGDPYVERAAPAGQQLRDSVGRASSSVRRSVPLRTLLFVLPPLLLPALAFDLSPLAMVVVALLLLWLAAAAGVFCTMMVEGSGQLVLRALERRLRDGGPAGDGAADSGGELREALMALGAQLDRLDDRVSVLAKGGPGQDAAALSHRPAEHVPDRSRDEQYDRYGQTAVPDTNWGESRWRR